ncbi:MAG: hypothetical protein IKB01_01575 [Lachnospiraceae bacterium]|nr:hypothetical protein [Lachnospiraceae bacterium]MBR2401446.1 hypothetical protein [Lachnospiraceae bacterium]MBR3684281.1 hypothetical protein [Lachnospiraceae bacterium]
MDKNEKKLRMMSEMSRTAAMHSVRIASKNKKHNDKLPFGVSSEEITRANELLKSREKKDTKTKVKTVGMKYYLIVLGIIAALLTMIKLTA